MYFDRKKFNELLRSVQMTLEALDLGVFRVHCWWRMRTGRVMRTNTHARRQLTLATALGFITYECWSRAGASTGAELLYLAVALASSGLLMAFFVWWADRHERIVMGTGLFALFLFSILAARATDAAPFVRYAGLATIALLAVLMAWGLKCTSQTKTASKRATN